MARRRRDYWEELDHYRQLVKDGEIEPLIPRSERRAPTPKGDDPSPKQKRPPVK